MSRHQSSSNSLKTVMEKFFLSAFVIVTFLAYIVHERLTTLPQANNRGGSGTPTPSNGAETVSVSKDSPIVLAATETASVNNEITPASNQADAPSISTDTPTLQPVSTALYKDGTYTGSEADAYYGLVQVQAVIENGKISAVSFLEYPNHRRTSERINLQAMPWLQQEVIQAQTAQVDLISGATLTSEAFVTSLQAALNLAKN